MIVPMQKVTLFVSARDKERALQRLRKLGVLHIHQTHPPVADDLSALERKLGQVEKCLGILGKIPQTNVVAQLDERQVEGIVMQTLTLADQRAKLIVEQETEREKQAWFQAWGAVSRSELAELKSHGIYIRLYLADKAYLKHISPDKIVYIVGQERNKLYLVLVTADENERLDLKEEFPPAENLQTVKQQLDRLAKAITQIDENLQKLAAYQPAIEQYLNVLKKRYEFARVRAGMADLEAISYLEGFCPDDRLPELKALADQAGWGYFIEEPDNPAVVPTLIRRPKWLNIVEPIFRFMGTIPGYNEYDISFWFLCFFSLFFAILIGDAGYGLVFLIAGILLRRKFKNAPREPFILLYVLSGALIIWGAITGNWFGFEKIARLPLFNLFIIERINTWSADSERVTYFLMYLTFLIGALHLSIGHTVNGLKKFPALNFLAQLGWVFVVWGMFFLANTLVLSKPLPKTVPYLIGVGAVLIACFDNYQKGRFWRGFGATIGNLPLSIISSFGDVVSYLRLFAVGLAGSVVEISFNNMATGEVNNFLKVIIAIVVLIFGHTLNMALCAMSVIVHGIRLNMLEFSSHLGMTWSGHEYRPFKE